MFYTVYDYAHIYRSLVVDHIEHTYSDNEAVVAYIYNDYKEREAHSVVNLIGSLLQQVLRKKLVVSDEMSALHSKHTHKNTRPTFEEISRVLRAEIDSFSDVFFIVDAMDECQHANGIRDGLLAELCSLQEKPNVRLMMTSRFLSTLETNLQDAVRLEIMASNSDIIKYLEVRISEERRLARLIGGDVALQTAIINTIVSKAQGMSVLRIPVMYSFLVWC